MVKSSLSTPWKHTGGGEVQLHSFLISALDGGEWSTSCPCRTTLAKNPDTHLTGDGVGTREPVWSISKTVSGSCRIRNPDSPARGLVAIPSSYKHTDHFKLKYFIQLFCNQRLPLLVSIAMPQVLLPIARLQINPTLNHY